MVFSFSFLGGGVIPAAIWLSYRLQNKQNNTSATTEARVLPKILDGGVPHGFQNPDPISD